MKRFVSYKLRPERLTRYHITMYEKSTDRTEGAVRRKTIALANFLAVSLAVGAAVAMAQPILPIDVDQQREKAVMAARAGSYATALVDIEILRAVAILLVVVHHAKGSLFVWHGEFLNRFYSYFWGPAELPEGSLPTRTIPTRGGSRRDRRCW